MRSRIFTILTQRPKGGFAVPSGTMTVTSRWGEGKVSRIALFTFVFLLLAVTALAHQRLVSNTDYSFHKFEPIPTCI